MCYSDLLDAEIINFNIFLASIIIIGSFSFEKIIRKGIESTSRAPKYLQKRFDQFLNMRHLPIIISLLRIIVHLTNWTVASTDACLKNAVPVRCTQVPIFFWK